MKTLKFSSSYQDHISSEVFVGSAKCAQCSAQGGWHNGDVKQVTDSDAELLLRNPSFSEVPTQRPKTKPADNGAEVSTNG